MVHSLGIRRLRGLLVLISMMVLLGQPQAAAAHGGDRKSDCWDWNGSSWIWDCDSSTREQEFDEGDVARVRAERGDWAAAWVGTGGRWAQTGIRDGDRVYVYRSQYGPDWYWAYTRWNQWVLVSASLLDS